MPELVPLPARVLVLAIAGALRAGAETDDEREELTEPGRAFAVMEPTVIAKAMVARSAVRAVRDGFKGCSYS